MPHVTFIHGIANKVEKQLLEQSWIDSLRDGGGPDLWSEGVETSMCYWADVLYEKPLPPAAASTEAGEEAEVLGAEDVGLSWYASLPSAEGAAVRELAAEIGATSWLTEGTEADELEPDLSLPVEAAVEFERVPLPGPVKRRLMKTFLRDVHHYLWNVSFSPRPGVVFTVRDTVRSRALEAMSAAGMVSPPHIVVGHSLGSVIAYDVLQNVDGAPTIDGLLTLGSPLGLDEVQDRLDPGWSRWDVFPSHRVAGAWVNIYDRLDPVCGFDPDLAHDFRRAGDAVVDDIKEPNWGTWRHSVGKYLRGPQLRKSLDELLDLA